MASRQAATQSDTALLDRRRRQFEDAWSLKVDERAEQREARRYYHGSHWTEAQLKELKKRGQPPTVTPAYARKINGFVGLLERMRQDPKAYPRTEKENQGAELCTAALRYGLDEQQWADKSFTCGLNLSVDAICGVALSLTPGDSGAPGDYDIGLDVVEPDYFFYDPRSFKNDFSDARFMGESKWMDIEDAKLMFPDKAEELESAGDWTEYDLSEDRDIKWTNMTSSGAIGQARIVEHWYKRGEEWHWCFYTGSLMLDTGRTFMFDEKNKDMCRYIMASAFVDQDGDRYSFHRYMKTLTDEINQRNSKALHLLSMRRIRMERGAVEEGDVEKLRRESNRPDGVIVHNKGFELEFEDAKTLADMQGQLAMKEASRTELENFGPNPALIGQGVENRSGRAIALMQQAGIAELGPFTVAHKGWKLRIYRAVWNAIGRYWTAQRWIRVVDGDGNPQPVQVNGREMDPATGQEQIFNQIGALDVDIIIDEGPDAVNMQADALDTLQAAASQGAQIPPQVMIELLPIPDTLRRKLQGMLNQAQQPDPQQQQLAQQGAQIQLAQGAAKVKETEANAMLKMSQAQAAARPEMPSQGAPGPTPADELETLASVEEKRASATLKYAQAEKTNIEARLAPMQAAQAVMAKVQRVESFRP